MKIFSNNVKFRYLPTSKYAKSLFLDNIVKINQYQLSISNNKNIKTSNILLKSNFCKQFCSVNNSNSTSENKNENNSNSKSDQIEALQNIILDDYNNTPPNIISKIGSNRFKQNNHPLEIITKLLKNFFLDEVNSKSRDKEFDKNNKFEIFDNFSPVVNTKDCFTDLLVEDSHETMSPKNTYFLNKNQVLRTHMTTHDVSLLRNGKSTFVSIGDVYRRDTIDCTHYPVFHQIDGVRVYKGKSKEFVFDELKYCLENLVKSIVGEVEMRWIDAYFPFTEPSAELEIFYEGKWLEVLGCGVLRDKVLENANIDPKLNTAWAFGIGIERLAMTLFKIKDIRLFWSEDNRFINQFKSGKIVTFKPYSKYPPCYKDFSFFLNKTFEETDFHQLVRDCAGDIAEEVKCIDKFVNKAGNTSMCFRVNFRHMERSLTNEEINDIQFKIRDGIKDVLKLELR